MCKKSLCLLLLMLGCTSGFGKDSGIPHVVKRFHLYNQTGPIEGIAIYTPKRHAMYRLSAFMVTVVGTGIYEDMVSTVSFTDHVGLGTAYLAGLDVKTTGNVSNGVAVVRSVAGRPLILTLVPSGGSGAGAYYTIDIVIEEL